jgi:hypothetical protein
MTQEEFIEELKERSYSYEIEGDEIVVTHQGDVRLDSLKSLPPGVQFQNRGNVNLPSLKILPSDVRFENQGDVNLHSLKSLPSGVRFENQGYVWLPYLESLPPGVRFQNQRDVWLASLVGGWFEDWKGNIEGVDPKRLLNLMIDKGVFL